MEGNVDVDLPNRQIGLTRRLLWPWNAVACLASKRDV